MSKTKEVTEVTEVGVEEAVQALVSDATRRALQDASAAVVAESVPVCVEEVVISGDLAIHDAVISAPAMEAEAEVKADDFPTWEFPPVVLPTTANARITATLIISVASALPPQNTGIGLSNAGLAVRTGEGTTISSLLIEQAGHSLEQMRQIVSVFAGAPTAGVMADTANQAIAARLSAMADKAAVRSNREQFLVRQQAEFNVKFAAETDGVALSIAAVVDDSIAEAVLADLIARDERDSNRAIAPLRPADDAVLLDTSGILIGYAGRCSGWRSSRAARCPPRRSPRHRTSSRWRSRKASPPRRPRCSSR